MNMPKRWRNEDLTRGFEFCRVVTSFISTTRTPSMARSRVFGATPCMNFNGIDVA